MKAKVECRTNPGVVEASGSVAQVPDLFLPLRISTPAGCLAPAALNELKTPDPLIPVLDPSSAAVCEITEGPAFVSLNLFTAVNGIVRGGYCIAWLGFSVATLSHFEGLLSVLPPVEFWDIKEAEIGLIWCIPKDVSSSCRRLGLSPPEYRSNWYRTKLPSLE